MRRVSEHSSQPPPAGRTSASPAFRDEIDQVTAQPDAWVGIVRRCVEQAPVPVAVVGGAAHVLVFANAAFRQLSESIGATAASGVSILDALPKDARESLHGLLDRVRHDGVAVCDAQLERPVVREPGARPAIWTCHVWPLVQDAGPLDYLVVTIRAARRREGTQVRQRAITERLLFTALREQDLAQRADSSRARAVFLAETSRHLVGSVELNDVYAAIAKVALPEHGAWSFVDVDQPDGSWRRLPIVHPDPTKAALVQGLAADWSPESGDAIGAPCIARSHRSTIVDADAEPLFSGRPHSENQLRLIQALGCGQFLVVPLIAHQRLRGAITFVSPTGATRYTQEDVRLAEDLASRCAELLDGARLYESVQLARIDADRARARAEVARNDAERASDVKTSFLSSMSHELRTPLNAILGYAELMAIGLHGPVSAAQTEALDRIRHAGTHLLGLISDVLNFAKLKALQVRFMIDDVPVGELMDSAAVMVDPQVLAKALVFVRSPFARTLTVHADRDKVLQILVNLLSNAIKFTDTGGQVTLSAMPIDRRLHQGDGRLTSGAPAPAVQFVVEDTGCGIAAEQLKTIFEPFVQLGQRHLAPDEGTGLGLAISRDLARAMGGELTVRSRPGAGSRFALTLPCTKG